MTASVTAIHSEVEGESRPLKVLITLIREDLTKAKEASRLACMPFYCAIGEKLLEAKLQLGHEFLPWADRHFSIGKRQATEYINLAIKNRGLTAENTAIPISLRQAIREARPDNPNYGKSFSWKEDVNYNIHKARADALSLIRQENLSRQQEREAERKMALRLIDIGFKVLAKELHPDKGGTRDAMSRLSRVRDRLKQHA